jgi:integrase/recombinase XerC
MTGPNHAIVQASPWTQATTRKRAAVLAAHNQDQIALNSLLEYHLRRYSQKSAKISLGTLDTYSRALNRFLTWCGPAVSPRFNILRLEDDQVREWLYDLAEAGQQPQSVRTYVAGVRGMYRSLIWAGAIKADPFNGIPTPKDRAASNARRRALSVTDYASLLEFPRDRYAPGDPRVTRDRLMIGLGAS